MQPSEEMYNTLLYMYAAQGELPAAFALWQEMKASASVRPSSTSYGAMIKIFTEHGDLNTGLGLLHELEESQIGRPTFVGKKKTKNK